MEEIDHVDLLSRWLSPADQVLAALTRDHTTFADEQAEFTCLWFQKPLSKFVQGAEKVMLITGKSGCGKTTLSSSIAERLQRPLGRKSFHTIFCSISTAMPTQATSINVAKTILFQLLGLRSGDTRLFHALTNAHEKARTAPTSHEYESHLWKVITDVLKDPVDKAPELVLIIDGIDEVSSESKEVMRLFEQLYHVVDRGKAVRMIVLSQDLKLPNKHKAVQVAVSNDDVRDDLQAVALRTMVVNDGFKDVAEAAQDSILNRLVTAANGSFIWVTLACEVVLLEKAESPVAKIVDNLVQTRPAVQDLIARILHSLSPGQDGLTILNWLLESERPFTFAELRALFSVDYQKNTTTDRHLNIPALVTTLRPFLTVNGNIVRIRHSNIMIAARNLVRAGKLPVPSNDAETDLLYRTLSYAKTVLKDKNDPSFKELELGFVNRLFNQHVLLEYVVRYWPRHLDQCRLNTTKAKNEFEVTPELKKVLPEGSILSLLELRCWATELPPQMALEQYLFANQIRKQIFHENSVPVLQTYIAIATFNALLDKAAEAAQIYWTLTKISRSVLGDAHELVIECSHRFLEITETMTFTSRTAIATYKEEVLKIMITVLSKIHGHTSEQVIEVQRILATFYTAIQEEEHAQEIYRLISVSTDLLFEEESARKLQDHLHIDIKRRRGAHRGAHGGDGADGTLIIEEDDDELIEVFDFAQIEVLIQRALQFHTRGQLLRAEQTFIELWQQVSSHCRSSMAIEWHEKNIDVAVKYSEFLRSTKREVECVSILSVVWQQYEHHELRFSETIVERLTSIAKTTQRMACHSFALSIFQYAQHYYSSHKTERRSALKEIEEHIATASTEVLKETSITTTVTESSRSTITSVFKSMIKNSSKTIETSTMQLAKRLTSQYYEQQEYHEAMSIAELTLRRTWASFFSESIESISLTTSFAEESIEIAIKLAECHLHLRELTKVEDVYLRLFRSVLLAKSVHMAWLDRARYLLVSFYDSHGYADRAIALFQEILIVQRRTLGSSHKLTIETLYILGSRCRAHARNHLYWIEYYQQIIVALGKDTDICHPDAMEAYDIVSTYYWEDRRYAEAISVYSVIWNTFVLKVKEYRRFNETKFVQAVFQRYMQCLEETKVDFEVVHKVATQYRETCFKAYGAKAEITVEASMSLAKISQRSEKYQHEAIAIYEEISSSSSSNITLTSELSSSYTKQLTSESSSSHTKQLTSKSSSIFSASFLERAMTIQEERYAEMKSKSECSSLSTLSTLRELSILLCKQKKTESIVKEMSHIVSEITIKEKSSQKLLESATYIAETFQMISLEHTCVELVEELHVQLIARHIRKESKFAFNLTTCARSSLIFLAGLQFHLRKDRRLTFSEVMVDLISEAFQYDSLRRMIAAKSPFEETAMCAATLYATLCLKKRQHIASFVEQDVVKYFVDGQLVKHKLLGKESFRIFITAILQHVGKGRSSSFVRSVIIASNKNIAALMQERRWAEAYDVAAIAFQFTKAHGGFDGAARVGQGFRLALLLSGRGTQACDHADFKKQLLALSKTVIHDVLEICKQKDINLAQIQLTELNQLAALLGDVEDYQTLEWLLSSLWHTRDTQRSWPAPVLLTLGRRLICARFLAGHTTKALRLCEDIAYNMRRVHGTRHAASLEMYELLAQLYSGVAANYQKAAASGDKAAVAMAQAHFRKALLIHEDLLKCMVYEGTAEDSDDDEYEPVAIHHSQHTGVDRNGPNETVNRETFVKKHLRLLKLAYQRLGSWPKSPNEYLKLNADTFGRFGGALKGEQGVEKWTADGFGAGKAESAEGVLVNTKEWDLVAPEEVQKMQEVILRTL
ncbi:hypothetical protein ANO11243_094730 [Dothideomycetidae sp. 11243]|nr:hypothetical protein ANO11243_094730 [fungal sp. No.11243]